MRHLIDSLDLSVAETQEILDLPIPLHMLIVQMEKYWQPYFTSPAHVPDYLLRRLC
jgi:hypothetical protein